MTRIEIAIPGEQPYDLALGSDSLLRLGQEIKRLGIASQILIITDTEVSSRYLLQARAALEHEGYHASVVTIPSGEEAKSVACVAEVWHAMAECGLSRDSVMIALGGGVVGDLAGFAASTFMRGVRVIQVPTTLLSMVDSSVGGKTAINLDSGKNLVGTFFQPCLVCADVSVLQTLPDREWACGCGEIAKSAVIDSEEFFIWLADHARDLAHRTPDVVQETIERCIRFKADVVVRDKQETAGLRECLNYGHTLAHAIEAIAGYGVYAHGHAVAEGMRFAARLSAGLGCCDLDFVTAQDELLDALDLPLISLDASVADVMDSMKRDKKVRHGILRFVVPRGFGKWEVRELADEAVAPYVQAWLGRVG